MSFLKRLKGLWIILFWLVAIAGLLEGGLRLFPTVLPARLQEIVYTVINGTPFAQEWDTAWVRNREHYFIVKPGLENALQYGSPSVSFRVNTIELWDGGGIGFRNRPVDYFVDAVVVGDSFTFCFTEREDCWVTHLEQNTGMGIVNLGQPATGTRSHYLILDGYGKPYKPPLVIWQFFGNDFNDDYGLLSYRGEIEQLDGDVLANAEANSQSIDTDGIDGWLRTNSVAFAVLEVALTGNRGDADSSDNQFNERYEVLLDNGERLGFGQPYEPLALDMQRPANQAGRDASRESFQQAVDLTASWGGQMVVVLIPTREEVYESVTADLLGDDLDKIKSARYAMLDLCSELDLLCYDALNDLQISAQQGESLYYYDDMHFNPNGNRILAQWVQAWLNEQGLLP
jgi:SGNH hydrolase-like domain, acetyltransferase AlgX